MNYYDILGVDKNINNEELKNNYKKKLLEFHPDKNIDLNTNEEYCHITQAYQILSNPILREKYNLELELDNSIKEFKLDFIYHNLLSIKNIKLSTIYSNIEVSILELYHGCFKPLTIEIDKPCHYCFGLGCLLCHNSKIIKQKIQYNILIEKGMKDGDVVGIYPYKTSSINIIKIQEINETKYVRKGSNLYYTIDISLYDSINNSIFYIDYIDNTQIKIESNEYIRPDSKTIIKNKGMPIRNKPNLYGDLIILYNIIYPDKIQENERMNIIKYLPNTMKTTENINIEPNNLDEIEDDTTNDLPQAQQCPMQ